MPQLTVARRIRDIIGAGFGADLVEMNLEKAIQEARDRASSPMTQFYDPMSLFMGREWLQKRTGLGYRDLRAMANNPIIWSIISTRKNQVAAFCYPQKDDYSYGYTINARDPTTMSAGDLTNKQQISNWLYQAGIPGYGEDLLETLARKFIEDSLIMDQACVEIVQRRDLTPAYLVAVDGATIRKLKASLDYATPPGSTPLYCQVINDVITAQYTDNQLIFGTRNPKTDIEHMGYGQSELETLIRTVATIVNAERYNAGQLAQGGITRGILVVAGDGIDNIQLESFKRDFREATRNAATYWRPPLLQVSKESEVDWVSLDRSQKDMEYAQLFDFLVKQACGVYQIDPAEVNWTITGSGVSTNFESGGDKQQELSQWRGLKPLLVFLANQLNNKVISRIDPRFILEFEGLNKDRKADLEVRKTEVSWYKTLNEVRKELGLPPLPWGNIVLNENYVKALTGDVPPTQGGSTPTNWGMNLLGQQKDSKDLIAS